ncbi:hypothetical protein ACQRIU_003099 [Beauveria bassiana]
MRPHPIQYHQIDNFQFQDGSPPASVKVAYLDINPTSDKTALVLSCFRGRLHSTPTFANGALKDYRVIVAALFGNGESSSPSNMAKPPGMFDYRDCVQAQRHLLLYRLRIAAKLDLVLGFSMGGQCAYHWTLMYPEAVLNAVIICSSARSSRHNYQFLEGPKSALENSCDYKPGTAAAAAAAVQATEKKPLLHGLRAFGKAYSAWLTSAEWFDQEMYKSLGYETLSDWDREVAGTNYHDWHPDDLLSKIRTWQHGDITKILQSEGNQVSLRQACSLIQARVLLMPCRTDQYFRWEASEKESHMIPRATLQVIPSIWGHLAGLGVDQADMAWMDVQIGRFLAGQQ